MKLVIEHQWGSEFSGGEAIWCCDYDSAEAFLVNFENKVKSLIEKKRQEEEECRKWSVEYYAIESELNRTKKPEKIAKIQEKLLEIMNKRPTSYSSWDFIFAGIKFELHMFGQDSVDLPNVYELNEWFEKKKQDEILWLS